MALLAEEIVAECLNRQSYFTIRGAKLGIDKIDLTAHRGWLLIVVLATSIAQQLMHTFADS